MEKAVTQHNSVHSEFFKKYLADRGINTFNSCISKIELDVMQIEKQGISNRNELAGFSVLNEELVRNTVYIFFYTKSVQLSLMSETFSDFHKFSTEKAIKISEDFFDLCSCFDVKPSSQCNYARSLLASLSKLAN